MNKQRFIFFCVAWLCAVSLSAQVSGIVGDWKTVDDKSGEVRSIVHIYKATDGLYYGKIAKLLKENPESVCVACTGADKDKPVQGMVIIRGMHEDDGELVGGRILDPESGKFYYAKLYLKDGKLILRGSLDKRGFIGRNQTWLPAK